MTTIPVIDRSAMTAPAPRPTYLFFHPAAYRAGVAYERLVSRSDRLAGLRANLLGVLEAV